MSVGVYISSVVKSGRTDRYSGAEKSGPPHQAASARVGKRPKRNY